MSTRILPIPQVPILFFVGGKLEVPMERRSKEYDHERFFEVKNSSNMLRWRRFIHSSSQLTPNTKFNRLLMMQLGSGFS